MYKLRKRLKEQRGFSFIELLVAVVVIGILASMAVPRVVGVMGDAKSKACQANIKSLESALERFYAKEGNYPESLDNLMPNYLKEIPTCPLNGDSYEADYQVITDNQGYSFNHAIH